MDTYEVLLWLKSSSQPIRYDALAVYVKEAYTCITFMRNGEKRLHKYPTADVFRIEEEYKYLPRQSERA